MANAQEIYYLANNEYASTFDELDVDLPQKTGTCKFQGMILYPECYELGEWEIAIAKTSTEAPFAIESYFERGNIKITSYLQHERDLSILGNITCTAQPAPGQTSGRSELGKKLCKSLGSVAINNTDYQFRL